MRIPDSVLLGLAAGSVALGAGELLAAVVPGAPSLLLSVGDAVIKTAPSALTDPAVRALGSLAKPTLIAGLLFTCLALAGTLGAVAMRSVPHAAVGCAVVTAGVGLLCARGYTGSPLRPIAVTLTAGAAGFVVLRWLVLKARDGQAGRSAGGSLGDHLDDARTHARRDFLRLVAAGVGAGAASAATGRLLDGWRPGGSLPEDVTARLALQPLALPAGATSPDIKGLTPLFTSNERFYRIDTALSIPRTDLSTWRLRVKGMVQEELELSYDELASMPQTQADITLVCVSNEVGGSLLGTAQWQGVRLSELLRRARVQPGASHVVGRSIDGWTTAFPTTVVGDQTNALVALSMNGKPLPLAHGFPARLVVPGLYGYGSATKWLAEIELAPQLEGYWFSRGWAKDATVAVQSRFDVPRTGQHLSPGPHVLAGMAWASGSGISRVEVSVDDGPWTAAHLGTELNPDTWRQWWFDWAARPGRHQLRVRATDGEGRVQSGERRGPIPEAATGHHTVRVSVTP